MTRAIKTIVVYGATGAQGNSLAKSLLRSTEHFSVRALTRNASSPKAQELASLGAEVFQVDGFDLDQMRKALAGAWGFWLNTHHHEPALATAEGVDDTIFGKRLVDVASQAGVKILINSTCEPSSELSGGKAVVKPMDEKHKVFQHALAQTSFEAVIGAIPGWYMENCRSADYTASFGGFPLTRDADGYMTFRCPHPGGTGHGPWIAIADDLGDQVHGLFLDPMPYHGRKVQLSSDYVTFGEVTAAFTKVTGQKARFVPCTIEEFPTHGVIFLEEIRDIFKFAQHMDGSFLGPPHDMTASRELKKLGTAHQVGQGSKELMTIKEYFKKYFT